MKMSTHTMMPTVQSLLILNLPQGEPLLSEYDAEFWEEYIANYERFDTAFAQKYAGYVFYYSALWEEGGGDPDKQPQLILTTFKKMVYNLLLKNHKKYTELWRIHTIEDDESYALTNNYDRHEIYSGTEGSQSAAVTGQRTDVNIDNIGSQNSSNLDKVTGWDSSSENTNTSQDNQVGSRQDTHQFTKGQETDTARTTGQDSHTSHIYGNIGVSTVDDMLGKHRDFWMTFSFYDIVFDDICRELLLYGED